MFNDAKGKPFPDIFLKAAERMKCLPQECIVVEDAPNRIQAAKAAGMKCVAITTTHKRSELDGADKIIDSFEELTTDSIREL